MRRSNRLALIAGLVGLVVSGAATAPVGILRPDTWALGEAGREDPRQEQHASSAENASSVAPRESKGAESSPGGRTPSVRAARDTGSAGPRARVRMPTSDESEVRTGGVRWIGIFEAPGQPLVSAGGLDLSAPRDLTLWKLDEAREHATSVTHLRSEVGRPFLAENLLLSAYGARLVAAPSGSDPFGPEASTIIEVPSRDASKRENSK